MTEGPSDISPKDVFVGRQDLLAALIPHVRPRQSCVADTYGVGGIGKTRFLDHLESQARKAIADGIFLRDSATELGGMSSGASQPAPEPSIARALQHFYGFLEQVRESVLEQTDSDRRVVRKFVDFNLAVQAARPELEILAVKIEIELKTESIRAGAESQSKPISETEEMFRQVAELRRARVTECFAKALGDISMERAVLWAIDDFESIAGQRMGEWLLDLINKIDGGLVVLSRVPTAQEPTTAAQTVLHESLRLLSEHEVQSFLEQCLPGHQVADGVAAVVTHFTDGHPGMLGLVAELLQQDPGVVEDRERVEARLRELAPGLGERQIRLVESIVPESERATLEICTVVRQFDADLLAELLGEEVPAVEAKIELLYRHTFIERTVDRDTGTMLYRLHGFIRRGIEEKLRDGSQLRYTALHQRAATFYFRWLSDFDELEAKASTAYGGWYRYEDRRWQRYMREWLYHQALADRSPAGGLEERQRRTSRIRFARVFLDAFWWWGSYIDFPFCRSLIDDWGATQQDVRWVEDLRLILNLYPTGWRKQDGVPWDEVRRALIRIRRACALDGKPGSLGTADQRHTRALINLLLAHAASSCVPTSEDDRAKLYADAVGYYTEAEQLFAKDKDTWDCAWTLFQRAELHDERGSGPEAMTQWNAAIEIVREEEIENEELVANLHRLRSDIEWRRGDAVASLAATGRAVVHGYLFQNRPHPPDTYTAAFYQEMLDRARNRTIDAWPRADRKEAVGAMLATGLVSFRHGTQAIGAALSAPTPEPALALLPRGPRDEELGLERSPFLDDDWTDLSEAVAVEAAADLHTV